MLLFLALCYLDPTGAAPTPLPVPNATGSGAINLDNSLPTRTLLNAIWSCLSTIFGCTWLAIHPNTPEPEEATENPDTSWWSKRVFDIRRFIRHKAPLLVTALLVPEYILAWAIRQWLVAGELANPGKNNGWTRTHGFFILMGGFHLYSRNENVQFKANDTHVKEEIELNGNEHRIPVIQPFDDPGIPIRPLDVATVLKLLQDGKLELPTEQEIMDCSKTDALSKVIVLGQTGWFILQCIARWVQHLPVTKLEIITLAYTTLALWIYLAWWAKPQNVDRPIRVYLSEHQVPSEEKEDGELHMAENNLFDIGKIPLRLVGAADHELDIGRLHGIPTFYSGNPVKNQVVRSDIITLVFGVIFGAVHCFAWVSEFPTDSERTLWRISAISITGVPALITIYAAVIIFVRNFGGSPNKLVRVTFLFVLVIFIVLLFLGGFLYILARLTTLVLAVIELRSLPLAAYQDVYWTSLLPHI